MSGSVDVASKLLSFVSCTAEVELENETYRAAIESLLETKAKQSEELKKLGRKEIERDITSAERFWNLLEHADTVQRLAALRALKELLPSGIAAFRDIARRFLADPATDRLIAGEACSILGMFGDDVDMEHLESRASSTDPFVSREAERALRALRQRMSFRGDAQTVGSEDGTEQSTGRAHCQAVGPRFPAPTVPTDSAERHSGGGGGQQTGSDTTEELLVTEAERVWREGEAAFSQKRQEWEAEHPNAWLAIHDGRVLVHSLDEDGLHGQLWAMRQGGVLGPDERVYIRKVGDEPVSPGPLRPRFTADFIGDGEGE